MPSLLSNAAFHHVELPCEDLELAEQFYSSVLGATVYMRRDATRRFDVPVEGSISHLESIGFTIDATYLRIGEVFRIGFLKRHAAHTQEELDHFAFTIDEDNTTRLAAALRSSGVKVLDESADRLLISDPFGMVIELWPRPVLERAGLL